MVGRDGLRIGGDETPSKCAYLFALGAIVGTIIRVGMWLAPNWLVDAVTHRTLS